MVGAGEWQALEKGKGLETFDKGCRSRGAMRSLSMIHHVLRICYSTDIMREDEKPHLSWIMGLIHLT
jgi:hypothetical protein